ncbi:MAG: 23S rRNA pseudouridylate synthase B [Phenylobacterium zucineum]|nr:MAG: 23S rRNA pseudouridylate synthase B [Phenylobacterium zucineum]
MVHDPLRTPDAPTGQSPEASGERIAKALARAGVASRREVERLIEAGRVTLNGRVLTSPAVKVGPGDVVTLDGEVVAEAEPTRLFRYHKPAGLMTSHNDPQGRPTVFDALPPGLPRLISVGRLDLNTEGLLLLTNDGGLARALELPSTALIRRYRARAHGRVTQDRLDKLKDGVTIEGVRYGAIDAVLDKAKEGPTGSNLWITLTLAEGKNREVRRVLESLGLKVNRLIRLSYGPYALATLPVGAVEEVGPRVIREQLAVYIDPENLPTGHKTLWRSAPLPTGTQRRVGPGAKTVSLRDPALPVTPAKKEYKAGWAKAKPKTGHPTKSRPSKPGPAVIGRNRPGDGPKRSGPARGSGSPPPKGGPRRSSS